MIFEIRDSSFLNSRKTPDYRLRQLKCLYGMMLRECRVTLLLDVYLLHIET